MLSAVRLLSLLLLLVQIPGSITIAHSHQDGNGVGSLNDASTRQDLWDDVVAATAKWDKRFPGRKILLFAILRTSKYSNAAVRCEVEGKGHHLSLEDHRKCGKILRSEEADDGSGFGAVDDYLHPSHHPPVNN